MTEAYEATEKSNPMHWKWKVLIGIGASATFGLVGFTGTKVAVDSINERAQACATDLADEPMTSLDLPENCSTYSFRGNSQDGYQLPARSDFLDTYQIGFSSTIGLGLVALPLALGGAYALVQFADRRREEATAE